MKKAVFIILALYAPSLFAQECNCPREKVLVYGPAMPSLSTEAQEKLPATEQGAWVTVQNFFSYELINAAGGSNGEILFESSSGYIDADTKTGHSSNGAPAPASGAVAGMHYIINTIVQGGPGAWQFMVNMEDAITREQVGSFSKTIASLDDYKAVTAGAIANWGSVLQKIRSYQKRKRDESHFEQMIYAKYKYRIEKNSLAGNESTTITFTLLDCDGEPIRDKEISPKAVDPTLGTFTTASMKTDQNGEARFTYKAREKAGQTTFFLNIEFQRISGHKRSNMVECGNLVDDRRYLTVKIPYTLFMAVEVEGEEKPGDEPTTHFAYQFSGQKNYKLSPVTGKKDCFTWESLDGPGFTFEVHNGLIQDKDGEAHYLGPMRFSTEMALDLPSCKADMTSTAHFQIRFTQLGAINETWERAGFTGATGGSFNGILLAAFMNEERKQVLMDESAQKLEKAQKELGQLKPGQLPDVSRIQALAKVWMFAFDMPADFTKPLIIDQTVRGDAQPEGIRFSKATIHFRLRKND